MALLRILKGSILEENFARTVGSIGESVAAGAIFTIPAFLIAGVWTEFWSTRHYLEASAIMLVGGVIGIMFVTVLRRVMVEDLDLPFPESCAASEIHKAGRTGTSGAKFLFTAMGIGAVIQALKEFLLFASHWEQFIPFIGKKIGFANGTSVQAGGGILLSSPGVSPAYIGVGYIIGPELAALNFTGGLLAWGLFVPLLLYFLGPELTASLQAAGADTASEATWSGMATQVWRTIVRPIAIGGMLMSAGFTLFRMRKSLAAGIGRAVRDVRKAAGESHEGEARHERDISFKWVFIGLAAATGGTFVIYNYFAGDVVAAGIATMVMVVAGFFFSAVSGNLVGLIGSSNNPISGLTISTLIIAALLMVILGVSGMPGVAAVLGVAAVICVAAAVAGEMLQDLKVGHILGGTPWKMQVGDLFGVALAAAVMFFPLLILHEGDIKMGGTGLGGQQYPAPQASLMAILANGIVGGHMAWPLIIVGILMGIRVHTASRQEPDARVRRHVPATRNLVRHLHRRPDQGLVDRFVAKRKFNEAQKIRTENNGVLLASGLIAGEALVGLVFALLAILEIQYTTWLTSVSSAFPLPFGISLLVFVLVAYVLISTPLKNAGRADEPAPPSAMM